MSEEKKPMMRLVDLGKVTIRIAYERGNGKREFVEDIEKALNALPTVEAIPIEWIEKWMERKNSWNLEGVITLLRDWAEREEE